MSTIDERDIRLEVDGFFAQRLLEEQRREAIDEYREIERARRRRTVIRCVLWFALTALFAASFLVSSYAGNKTLAGMMLAVYLVAMGALVGSAGRSDAPETERIVIVLRQGGRRP